MRSQRANSFFASVVAMLLLVTAGAAIWVLATSGVLAASSPTVDGTPGSGVPAAADQAIEGEQSIRIAGAFQISQPRDPFRPLITPDSPVGGIPGVGGEPGTGNGNGNGNGNGGQTGTVITLQEIREVGGVLQAVVIVNGTTYEVGVGDTFAGSYKVVSLSEDRGVFTFGDKAFELAVGQQILK